MAYEAHTVTLTTNGAETATGYTPVTTGKIQSISYIKTDFTNGVDFAITTETTLQNVWVETNVDASETVAPRQPTRDYAGAASLYAAAGEPVEDHIWLGNERLKIVVTNGGATKTGTFIVIVG